MIYKYVLNTFSIPVMLNRWNFPVITEGQMLNHINNMPEYYICRNTTNTGKTIGVILGRKVLQYDI